MINIKDDKLFVSFTFFWDGTCSGKVILLCERSLNVTTTQLIMLMIVIALNIYLAFNKFSSINNSGTFLGLDGKFISCFNVA